MKPPSMAAVPPNASPCTKRRRENTGLPDPGEMILDFMVDFRRRNQCQQRSNAHACRITGQDEARAAWTPQSEIRRSVVGVAARKQPAEHLHEPGQARNRAVAATSLRVTAP